MATKPINLLIAAITNRGGRPSESHPTESDGVDLFTGWVSVVSTGIPAHLHYSCYAYETPTLLKSKWEDMLTCIVYIGL